MKGLVISGLIIAGAIALFGYRSESSQISRDQVIGWQIGSRSWVEP